MKNYISLLLFITLPLQGCISAVIFGVTATATKTVIDPRTIGTQIDDSILNVRVKNAVAKDQRLKQETRVINTVYQGKVLLTGQAPTLELIERAKQIVMDVKGVTKVYNEIRHNKPVPLQRIFIDSWITTKICFQLIFNDKIKSSNIKVTTESGEVFLLGLVTPYEGKKAAEIASTVQGVEYVKTAFTYVK